MLSAVEFFQYGLEMGVEELAGTDVHMCLIEKLGVVFYVTYHGTTTDGMRRLPSSGNLSFSIHGM